MRKTAQTGPGASDGRGGRMRSLYLGPWRIDVTRRLGVERLISDTRLGRVVARGLEAAGAPTPASVAIVLTDDAELADLNSAHLGKAGPTDVLSFPMLPPDAFPPHPHGEPGDEIPGEADAGTAGTGAPETATTAGAHAADPGRAVQEHTTAAGTMALGRFVGVPGARTHIGDIAISVERAAAQASQGQGGQTGDVRWSPLDELRLLALHGTLHLCGWDHAEPVEEAAMRALEQRILAEERA